MTRLPVRQRVDFKLPLLVYKALHDATAAYLVDDHQLVSHAGTVAGYDWPTPTRAVFHGPTHGSAIGASQPLDHGSGTVCQPGFASPTTTSENFVGSWSRFCLIDTAVHSDYCSYATVKYSYSLTHTGWWLAVVYAEVTVTCLARAPWATTHRWRQWDLWN